MLELTKNQKAYAEKAAKTEIVIELCHKYASEIIHTLDNEIKRWKEIALDMFIQACSVEGDKLDHMCMSTYEEAQEMLLAAGLLNEKMLVRKKVTKFRRLECNPTKREKNLMQMYGYQPRPMPKEAQPPKSSSGVPNLAAQGRKSIRA
jgi:hypothetical protein